MEKKARKTLHGQKSAGFSCRYLAANNICSDKSCGQCKNPSAYNRRSLSSFSGVKQLPCSASIVRRGWVVFGILSIVFIACRAQPIHRDTEMYRYNVCSRKPLRYCFVLVFVSPSCYSMSDYFMAILCLVPHVA